MLFPDNLLTLEGEKYDVTLSEVMHGYTDIDEAVLSLEERYNTAYRKIKEDGNFDLSIYSYDYNIEK